MRIDVASRLLITLLTIDSVVYKIIVNVGLPTGGNGVFADRYPDFAANNFSWKVISRL